MPRKEDEYRLGEIRKLLMAAFTAKDLRRFCQERPRFRPIAVPFGPEQRLDDMVDEAITYCEKWLLFDQLLDELQLYNPAQYKRFGPYRSEVGEDTDVPPTLPALDKVDRKAAKVYFHQGLERKHSGDLAGAIAAYTGAIELDSTYAEAYNNRGIARVEKGDQAGAIADYTRAIELDPNYAKAYNNRGNARVRAGDRAGAIADYTHAIELNPNYATAHYNTACTYARMGDPTMACAWLTKAIALDPKYRAKARTEPDFGPIRDEPCFQALTAEPITSP
jgi:tetratricopeptide (TPR) repeat protein